MIAVVQIDRQAVPSVFRNSATTVPTAMVSTTHTIANPTVLGSTICHRNGSVRTWT